MSKIKLRTLYDKEFTTSNVKRKKNQSFIKLGLSVIVLKYAAKPQIRR